MANGHEAITVPGPPRVGRRDLRHGTGAKARRRSPGSRAGGPSRRLPPQTTDGGGARCIRRLMVILAQSLGPAGQPQPDQLSAGPENDLRSPPLRPLRGSRSGYAM
jgi:hypothetical protein